MKAGEKKVEEKVATIGKDTSGWLIGSAFGDRNFYHGNWLLRAATAKAGIYGNDAVEAAYPFLHNDDKGEKADCSKHNYTITFPTGQGKESNWLPAPNGPIYMVMRLYWPKETPPSVLPAGEGTWKPPAVVRVK